MNGIPERTVRVDGNLFWMEVEPSGGYIVGVPVDQYGAPDWGAPFELDPRAFKNHAAYCNFRESIRFLLTYERA